MKTLLITGGAGFIGGCFVRRTIESGRYKLINLDALTYAGNLDSIPGEGPLHRFVQGDIGDGDLVRELLREHQPEAVINFAAESMWIVPSTDRAPLSIPTSMVLFGC